LIADRSQQNWGVRRTEKALLWQDEALALYDLKWGKMTFAQKLDLVSFVVVAVLGAVAIWRAGQYPPELARRVRFRASGIILGVSLLPVKAFLVDAFSTPVWALLIALITGGALFLFYYASRND
jgi:hypothetical protein